MTFVFFAYLAIMLLLVHYLNLFILLLWNCYHKNLAFLLNFFDEVDSYESTSRVYESSLLTPHEST